MRRSNISSFASEDIEVDELDRVRLRKVMFCITYSKHGSSLD